jgi:hypothetical protein
MRPRDGALAAAAHLAVFASYLGPLVSGALAVWGWRQRRAYLAQQAGQACAYQLAVLAGVGGLDALGLGSGGAGLFVGALHLLAMAYGAYGAMSALDGRPFRYLPGRSDR